MKYRAELAKKAVNCLLNGDSVLLVGPSGMGKSRFIRELTSKNNANPLLISKKAIFVNVNLDDLPTLNALELYRLALKRAFDQIEAETLKIVIPDEEKVLVKEGNNPSLLLEKLRTTLKMLCDADYSVVLSIDGLGRLIDTQNESFFTNLKGLRDYCSVDKFTFLFSAKREPREEDLSKIGPIYKLFFPFIFFLTPLEHDEAIEMVKDVAGTRNLVLPKKAVEEVFEITGGIPTLIKGVVLHLTQQPNFKIPSLLKNVNESAAVMVRLDEVYNHLDYEEQEVLREISAGPSAVDINNRSYHTLVRKGLVDENMNILIPLLSSYLTNLKGSATSTEDAKNARMSTNSGLFIDPATKRVYKNGSELHNLTKQEFRLMSYLNANKEKICDREEIIQSVWEIDENSGISDEAVDQLVTRLRGKIEQDKSNPQHLITVRGRGFTFKP